MLTLFTAAVIPNIFFQNQQNQKHSKISNSPPDESGTHQYSFLHPTELFTWSVPCIGQKNLLLGKNLANASELGAFYVKCMEKKKQNRKVFFQWQSNSAGCSSGARIYTLPLTWNHPYPKDFWRQWPLVHVLCCTTQTNDSFCALGPIAHSPCHNPSALSSSTFSLPALLHLPNSPTSPRFRFVTSELTLGKVQEVYQSKLPPVTEPQTLCLC